jgi:hypothetical protein
MTINRPNQPSLSKAELHQLADSLILQEPSGMNRCIDFVLSETRGLWHGRARAMMCRRLKHCQISGERQAQLTNCVIMRLAAGDFSEQFKDQIRLAMHFDPKTVFDAAHKLVSSPKQHVAKYAQWILLHDDHPNPPPH